MLLARVLLHFYVLALGFDGWLWRFSDIQAPLTLVGHVRSATSPVTLISPAMPIHDPQHLESQTLQLGTIALLAEWLELPDLHAWKPAPAWFGWVSVESRRNREIKEAEWLSKRKLDIWPGEGSAVCHRTDSEADEDVPRLKQPRLGRDESSVQ